MVHFRMPPAPWRILAAVAAFASFAGSSAAAEKLNKRDYRSLPDWLVASMALPAKDYGHLRVPPSLEVLRDEVWYEVQADGNMVERIVYAARILNKDGIKSAIARKTYLKETDKISAFDCWVINPTAKEALKSKKSAALDKSGTDESSLASSFRYLEHDARELAKVGDIFAYSKEARSEAVIGNETWYFQSPHPVRLSRINLKIPSGWSQTEWLLGEVQPQSGSEGDWRYWLLENIPPYEPQELSPASRHLKQSIVLSISPPTGSKLATDFISFTSWEEMSRLFTEKYRQQMVLSDEIKAVAQEAIQGAGSNFAKAKILAEKARAINYTSISLNIGLGGGYIPRSSQEVHQLGWGDCKDKATYLCSLLEAVGLQGYPVIVNGSPRHLVDPSVPAANQFNHCIAAIQADESFPESSTIEAKGLGRLMIFDPTDILTSVGDLNHSMHGTGAVLLAGDKGGFITLPRIEGDDNVDRCEVKAEVMPNGTVIGLITSHASGQRAHEYRIASLLKNSKSGLEDLLKDRLDDSLGTLKTVNFNFADDLSNGRFEYSLQFGAPTYAKHLNAERMILEPVLVNRLPLMMLDDPGEEREQPIMLDQRHSVNRFEIFLPIGFSPSELPEPIAIKTEFGEYSLAMELQDDQLIVERRLFISSKPLEPSFAEAVETFYRDVSQADSMVLTLLKNS